MGMPIGLFGEKPGGAESPGGGPLAVEKPVGEMGVIPFNRPGPVAVNGVDKLELLPGCPERTPSGFFEKLSRIPPFTLLWSWAPYSSFKALVANETSSNSTKHIGPFCFVRKHSRL